MKKNDCEVAASGGKGETLIFKVKETMKYFVSIGFLMLLSIIDIRKKKIPVWTVVLGMSMAAAWVVCWCASGMLGWSEVLLGILPGLFLLLLAKLTGKVGYGDGWILLGLGLVFGYRQCLFFLCVALMILSFSVIVLLFLRKVERNSEIPFLPYLTIAVIVDCFLCKMGG